MHRAAIFAIAFTTLLLPAGAAAGVDAFIYFFDKADGEAATRGRQVAVENFAWGAAQPPGACKYCDLVVTGYSLSPVGGIPGKSAPPPQSRPRSLQGSGDPDRPAILGTVPNPSAAPARGTVLEDIEIEKEVDKATPTLVRPLPRGSLTVLAPGLGRCAVGTRYPNLTFSIPERSYRLDGVTVAGCGARRGGDPRSAGTMSLNYDRISTLPAATGATRR
jgi:hypothetical protein